MRSRALPPLARLCIAAFLADMALYLTMTGAPYKALALGAGPLVLGLLPAARALPYSLSTVWAGGLTEGRERLRLARWSLVVGGLAVAALILAPGIGPLFAVLAVLGTALAFFWPAVQATLADIADRETVHGHLGWFNVAWSLGKGCGFLAGGFLLAGLGFAAVFAASAGALLVVAALVTTLRVRPLTASARAHPEAPAPATAGGGDREVSPARARRFRLAAWTANGIAFGVVAVLNTHYPNWLEVIGRGESVFGAFLGLIFFSQTAVFGILMRFSGWRYRAGPLLWSQVPLIGTLAVLPWIRNPAVILATAPLIGMGLGTAYFASLFYSVDEPGRRGRYAGVHEMLLGLGSLALPILGGWAAEATGRLQAPYLFAAAVAIVSVVFQAALLGAVPGRRAA